jgi:hypothetical protein
LGGLEQYIVDPRADWPRRALGTTSETPSRRSNTMSDQGPVIVHEDTGSNAAVLGIVLLVAVAIVAALFVWHPWSVTSTTNQTTVTQPNGQGGTTGNSSSSTTTTTNVKPSSQP